MKGPLEKRLAEVVGEDHVLTDAATLERHARDLWPRGFLEPPRNLPRAVVRPGDGTQAAAVLEAASEAGVPVVPYGGGSGVCAAVVGGPDHICLDASRLRSIEVNVDAMEVAVGAGVVGGDLDRLLSLQDPPLTLGHYPASLNISTVGGWVGTASSGQESTRYGSIGDMLLGLEVACSDGTLRKLNAEESKWFVGAEGTLGAVTKAVMRIHPKPRAWRFGTYSFGNFAEGVSAVREVIEAGLRPNVLRLYDGLDALLSLHGDGASPGPSARSSQRPEGPRSWQVRALRWAKLLARLAKLGEGTGATKPMLVVAVGGRSGGEASAAMAATDDVLRSCGAAWAGQEAARHWYDARFRLDDRYMRRIFELGAFVNTLDLWAPWEALADLRSKVLEAVSRFCLGMAHVSHCTEEGACLYVTYLGATGDVATALSLYDGARDAALEAAVSLGAKIAHQHGIGLEKLAYFVASEPDRHARLRALKERFDPAGVMNPGKLGIP